MNYRVKSNFTGEIEIIKDVDNIDQAYQKAKRIFRDVAQRIQDKRMYEFTMFLPLGYKFKTKNELNFKGFIIPKGTEAEVIEVLDLDYEYKVYFDCKGQEENVECIQILELDEINKIKVC